MNAAASAETTAEISIGEPKSESVDNYVYANLNYVEKAEKPRAIVLKGENPSDCFEFDRVEFISNGKDVYSVLPIMKQVKQDCPMRLVPFSIETQVPEGLAAKDLLLHVRGMDGRSVNSLFDNR